MKKLSTIILFTLLSLVFFILGIVINKTTDILPGTSTGEKTSYDLIGTATASTSPTATYASSTKTIYTNYLENMHLDIAYTSATNTKYLLILVEGSNDGGQTFFPLSTETVTSDEINLYAKDLNGNVGIPIVFPGDKTTTSSVEYKGQKDLDNLAEYTRISVKESGTYSTSTAGGVYIRGTFSSKN